MSDRKYKSRGYQESGRATEPRPSPPPRERPPAPPPDKREKPRGRGLGAPTEAVFRCARCGEAAPVGTVAVTGSRCASCGADLRTCTNCSSFDPGSRFECRQPISARVSPKDRANACDLFDARTRQEFAQEKPKAGGDARSAFDALFKI
jgi:hypothetical protein